MNRLPVVERELLVRARQARTQWMRVLVAGFAAATIIFLFAGKAGTPAEISRIGHLAFRILGWAGFLGASVGFLFTADCLSSERRAGTLGLLMLTRLSGPEVLLGKLVANGLTAVYGLIALTPALMLPVMAGGVVGLEVVRIVAASASMLMFTLCLGLHASSESQGFGEALTRAVVWFGFVMIIALIAGICPMGAFADSDPSNPSSIGGGFWPGLCSGPLWGLLFLGLAARSLRSHWKEQVRPAVAPPTVSLEPDRIPRRVGDADPLVWLLKRDGVRVFIIWIAVGLEFLSILLNPRVVRTGALGGISAGMVLTGLAGAGLFTYAGARFIMHLRKSGMFELLHATSIGIGRVGTTQWSILRGELFIPLLFLLSLALVQGIDAPGAVWGPGSRHSFVALFLLLCSVSLLFLNAVALCRLGMWFGLHSRRLLAAILWSVGLVLGLDLAIHAAFAGLSAASTATRMGGALDPLLAFVLVVGVPLACIVKQLWLIQWARRQVNRRLAGQEIQALDIRRPGPGIPAAAQPVGPGSIGDRA